MDAFANVFSLADRHGTSQMQYTVVDRVGMQVEQYSGDRLIPTGRDEFTPLGQLPVMRDTLDGIDASMVVRGEKLCYVHMLTC